MNHSTTSSLTTHPIIIFSFFSIWLINTWILNLIWYYFLNLVQNVLMVSFKKVKSQWNRRSEDEDMFMFQTWWPYSSQMNIKFTKTIVFQSYTHFLRESLDPFMLMAFALAEVRLTRCTEKILREDYFYAFLCIKNWRIIRSHFTCFSVGSIV